MGGQDGSSPMGCGGSRADAVEPRYLESWTRDTESTWLTGTDAGTSSCGSAIKANVGKAQEKKLVNTGTQCGKQTLRPLTREEMKQISSTEGKGPAGVDSVAAK